jgi:hypothetical protein
MKKKAAGKPGGLRSADPRGDGVCYRVSPWM